MEKQSMMNLFLIIIIFMTIGLNAQTSKMEPNRNFIPFDFIPSDNLLTKFNEQIQKKKEIILFIEKTKDTLNSEIIFYDIDRTKPKLYSIFLYNNTSDSLIIQKQDRSFYLIQEAKNENNEWKSIEYWMLSSCGNSYINEKLKPNGIMKTNSINYQGDFQTEIRFKLLNYNNVYYSNTLIGNINLEQFEFPKKISNTSNSLNIIRVGGNDLLKKIIFLEPNSQSELAEKYESWLDDLKKKREKYEKSKKN